MTLPLALMEDPSLFDLEACATQSADLGNTDLRLRKTGTDAYEKLGILAAGMLTAALSRCAVLRSTRGAGSA